MEDSNQINEFEEYVKTNWQNFQLEEDFHNVTLVCADMKIQTHKIVLSYSSPIFKEILKLKVNEHPLIHITGVKYTDLQNLVNFMYKGEVNVAQNDLDNFLSLAKDLKVKGLSEYIETNTRSAQNIGYNKGEPSPKRKHMIEKTTNLNIIQTLKENLIDVIKDEVIVTQGDLDRFVESAKNQSYAEDLIINGEPDEIIEIDQSSDKSPLDYDIRSPLSREVISEDKASDMNVLPEEKQMPAFMKTTGGIDSIYLLPIKNDSTEYKQDSELSHSERQGTSEIGKTKDIQFFCDKCFYKTPHMDLLQAHINTTQHNTIEESTNVSSKSKFCCDKCDKQYDLRHKLNRHKEVEHEGVRYPCDQCNFNFKSKQSLKIHNERAHDGSKNNSQFPVKLTQKDAKKSSTFSSNSKDKVHDGSKNNSQFPVKLTQKDTRKSSTFSSNSQFKCDQCFYKTPNIAHLQAHIKSTQHNFSIKTTEESAIKSTNFSSKSTFYCNKCNNQYSRADSLTRHKEVAHEGIRYPCDQCNTNPFVELRNLKIHKEKVHEGIKYPCMQCAWHPGFSELRRLKEHIKQVHQA